MDGDQTPAVFRPSGGIPVGCAKPGCGEAPYAHMGWALRHLYDPGTEQTPAEEQPPGADATACARCHVPFEPDSTLVDKSSRYEDTPYCRFCVERCQQRQSHLHLCMVCSKR